MKKDYDLEITAGGKTVKTTAANLEKAADMIEKKDDGEPEEITRLKEKLVEQCGRWESLKAEKKAYDAEIGGDIKDAEALISATLNSIKRARRERAPLLTFAEREEQRERAARGAAWLIYLGGVADKWPVIKLRVCPLCGEEIKAELWDGDKCPGCGKASPSDADKDAADGD